MEARFKIAAVVQAMNRNRHRASGRLIEAIRQQTHKGCVSSKQFQFQAVSGRGNCKAVQELLK